MATLYYAEHVHIAQTWTWIPTPYFCIEQKAESESVPESISGNVYEPQGKMTLRGEVRNEKNVFAERTGGHQEGACRM